MMGPSCIKALVASFIVGLSIAHAHQSGADTFKILPDAPGNFEAVRLRTYYQISGGCSGTSFVSMSGNKVTVSNNCGLGSFLPGPPLSFDVELGRFPAGNYTLEVNQRAGETTTTVYTTTFTVTERHTVPPYNFPVVDYTDHWWNPQESGWGLSIMQHPSDRLFAVWFVYDSSNRPVWYTLQPGQWTTSTYYSGPIYKTTGPYFGGPFNPNQVGVVQVGSGTLVFNDSNSGTFSYTVEGISGSKPISRLPF